MPDLICEKANIYEMGDIIELVPYVKHSKLARFSARLGRLFSSRSQCFQNNQRKLFEISAHANGVLAPGSAHVRPSARPPST